MAQQGTGLPGAVTTKDLYGQRVYKQGKKGLQKVGKVHNFVFHPTERRLVGVLVKRPDAALMFHRKDLFVRLGALHMEEGQLVIADVQAATDAAACKHLQVDFDQCVLWWNMPLCTQDGTCVGHTGLITVDGETGQVLSVTADAGATANTLLGTREIPADMIRGFKRGLGQEAARTSEELRADEEMFTGAILVDDAVKTVASTGGVAEKAGRATAKATHKVRVVKAQAQPKVDELKQQAGEATEKGLFAAGKQLGKASTMFSEFKQEYEKARHSDD
ncbi:MAG: PRC-barrel domain protein [Coriobacteriia bacterium]|nr:PRC-barrel domain protein [Coriobacteriia bacterium]